MKILATDFDGTLRQGESVGEKNLSAIEKWRNAGNLFGVITGRYIGSIMREILHENVKCDFIIANNGGLICDGDGKIISDTSADGKILPELTKYLKEYNADFYNIAYRDYEVSGDKANLNDFKRFTQVSTVIKPIEKTAEVTNEINSKFKDYVSAHQNGICIDITPYGICKSRGIEELLKMHGLDKSAAITAGDNLNDITMIRDFYGCAVKNAVPVIKEAAKEIFDDIASIIEAKI